MSIQHNVQVDDRLRHFSSRRVQALLVLLIAVFSLSGALPVRTTSATPHGGARADYRPYRAVTYGAYNYGGSVYVETCTWYDGCFQNPKGGQPAGQVRLDMDTMQNFLVMAYRGHDSRLYVSAKVGDQYFSAWKDLGCCITDDPVVLGDQGRVIITATGTNGVRYSKITYDGINYTDWMTDVLGGGIKPGLNILGRNWFNETVSSQARMRAGIVRISQGYDCWQGPSLNTAEMQRIITEGGVRTVIIRTYHNCYGADPTRHLLTMDTGNGESLLSFIQRKSSVLFYIEIGNEPDIHGYGGIAGAARARNEMVSAVNTLRPAYQHSHPNMKWMMTAPSVETDAAYFNEYFGYGSAANAFDAVAVHIYTGLASFAGGEHRQLDWTEGLTPNWMPIYITEINKNTANGNGVSGPWDWYNVANILRDAMDNYMDNRDGFWSGGRNGRVRGFAIFTEDADPKWCTNGRIFTFDMYYNGATNRCEPTGSYAGSNRLGQR